MGCVAAEAPKLEGDEDRKRLHLRHERRVGPLHAELAEVARLEFELKVLEVRALGVNQNCANARRAGIALHPQRGLRADSRGEDSPREASSLACEKRNEPSQGVGDLPDEDGVLRP